MGRDAVDILKDMLAVIVEALVDNEDAVHISCPSESDTIVFEVDAAREDVGKLIGRSGKTAGAMRHILGAAGAKLGVRSILIIPDKKSE